MNQALAARSVNTRRPDTPLMAQNVREFDVDTAKPLQAQSNLLTGKKVLRKLEEQTKE